MTAKQKLKMAEQQLAYWKQVAKEAKAELREAERAKKLPKLRKAPKRAKKLTPKAQRDLLKRMAGRDQRAFVGRARKAQKRRRR